MKKIGLLLALLLFLPFAHATTIGSANITAAGAFTLANGQTLTLSAQIVGCNNDQPIYNGSPISITPNQTPDSPFTADGNEVVSFTLPGNDQIICGGQNYSLYAITWKINGHPAGPTKTYRFVDGTTVNLSTAHSIGFVPPILNNTIGVQCPSGEVFNGYNADFTPVCEADSNAMAGISSDGQNGLQVQGAGSFQGTLTTSNHRSKLPRVNVTHPDFGAACANAADPTGTQDSTCAIQAAIVWAESNPQGLTWPTIYFPSGTYKISSALRVACTLHLVGDGEDATVIEATNNSQNAFTVTNIGQTLHSSLPNLWTCNGSLENMTIHATGGHLYTATLIEIDNSAGYTLYRVRGSNGGGRGLSLAGSTERLSVIDTEWDTVRWPIVAVGNELKFIDTQIAAGGEDSSGYCWGANCINGVFPNSNWNAGTLESASADGTTATFFVHATYFDSTSQGKAPISAGNYFKVSGTTGTNLDGTYLATSITNSVTSDPSGSCSSLNLCFEVQATSAANGTATVSAASWVPAMVPDRQASFYMSGAVINWLGGSIKSTWYQGCIQTVGVFSGIVQGLYCEGFPLHGQPHTDADIEVNGEPSFTSTTGPIASSAVPVASTQWFPTYVNDPADTSGIGSGAEYRIMPQDFAKGSVTTSAYVSNVQQGQYEDVMGVFAGDGKFHIITRNLSDSTAPANTAWPAGSIIAQVPTSNIGVTEISNSHLESIDEPGSNWGVVCNDSTDQICGEVIVGSIPNGYTTFSTAGQAGAGANVNVSLQNDEWWGLTNVNNIGAGFVKVSILGSVNLTGRNSANSETDPQDGQWVRNGVIAVQEADGTHAWASFTNPANQTIGSSTSDEWETAIVPTNTDSVTGQSTGSIGHQFLNSHCWYDTPPAGQTHSLIRQCLTGGPNNTGSNAYWELDSWSGSAWTVEAKVTSAGVSSGPAFSYASLSNNNTFLGATNYFGPSSGAHLQITNQGIMEQTASNGSTDQFSVNGGGNVFGVGFYTSHNYGFNCTATLNPAGCNAYWSAPSPGVISSDDATQGDGKGMIRTAGIIPGILYSAAGTALPGTTGGNNACASNLLGMTAVVSDATTPTYMGAYVSGGTITAAVICSYDGTSYSWLTH